MLFKTLIAAAAAATAFADQSYSLHAVLPGQGAAGMQALQIRGDNIVYGLTQGFSYFTVDAVGNGLVNVISPGQNPKELYAADDGELVINQHPSANGEGSQGGWRFEGEGSVKSVSYYGAKDWYSCNSETDPLHGGPVVHIKKGNKYACENPVHFTLTATVE
ncbi:hypothetical protein CJU89_2451 [Yarrowia sp. B02]|nr:hypothetical protein CJU89_2451 [Yarrowia sp. B02]